MEDQDLPEPRNIYEVFETDQELEKDGMWFDYMFGRFRLAYLGNPEYTQMYAEEMKPYIEAEARGLLDPKILRKIQIKCFIAHVLRDWKDVLDRDNKPLPYSKENAAKLLSELPHLFQMLRTSASNFANYRKIYEDGAVGN